MPAETWPNPSAKPKESLKETFKQRLDGILNKQLTVENIETFANEVLEELTTLTKDVLIQYGTNEELEPVNLALNIREQEDDAFKKLGLPDIQEILQRVIEVKNQIDNLRKYISEPREKADKVIVPPQDALHEIKTGEGQGITERKFIPRLLTLLYILETDFEIEKEQIKITEGKVASNMMRKTPYVRVEVADIGRTIYICDEEGNASYVFDTEKLEEAGISLDTLDMSDKGVMNELIAQNPGIGARIIQTKHWRMNMTELLGNDISEKMQEHQTEPRKPASEFKKREFLPFEEFQSEVRTLYPGKGDVNEWYQKERKKHPNWPSNPNKTYGKNGWMGYPELVNKENILKKERLSFVDFQAEVRSLYPQSETNLYDWYEQERIKHPKWPAAPYIFYKKEGWVGFPELLGMERTEFLPWKDFQKEVMKLCKNKENVQKWYHNESPKHPKWPSNPNQTYLGNGWVDWSELVGKENFLRKRYPPFKDFQTDVRNFYRGESDVSNWYQNERLKHPNWPSNPRHTYIKSGWVGFPELVGKK